MRSKNYIFNFNECKDSDFIKRGLDKKNLQQYNHKYINLCPDFESYPEIIKIFGNYNNPNRTGLSVLIDICD